MPLERTFDEPDTMYKLNEDNETVQTVAILGKKAFDEKLAQGWQPDCPRNLPFPTTLYKPSGVTLIVQNKAEKAAALENGWEIKRYAAPQRAPEIWEIPAAAAGSPAAAAQANTELAMKLIASNERQAALEKKVERLLAALESKSDEPEVQERKKPGPKPRVHEEVSA